MMSPHNHNGTGSMVSTAREGVRIPRRGGLQVVGILVQLMIWNDLVHVVSAWVPTAPCCRPSVGVSNVAVGSQHCTHLKAESGGSEDAISNIPLRELLMPSQGCDVGQMSTSDLAYIGDVVYELFIRSRTVWPSKRTSDLQLQVVALVRAEHQSRLLALMKEEFDFSDKEIQLLTRGRNSVTGSRNNRRNPAAYGDATALEAIVGFLYITDSKRCEELLNWINNNLERADENV